MKTVYYILSVIMFFQFSGSANCETPPNVSEKTNEIINSDMSLFDAYSQEFLDGFTENKNQFCDSILQLMDMDNVVCTDLQKGIFNYYRGRLQIRKGDFNSVVKGAKESIAYFNKSTEEIGGWMSKSYLQLGYVLRYSADYFEALQAISNGLAVLPENPDVIIHGALLMNMGVILQQIKDYDQAIHYYTLAKELPGDNALNRAFILNNLGSVHEEMESNQKAIEFYEEAILLAKENSFKYNELLSLCNISNLCLELDLMVKANEYIERAVLVNDSLQNAYLANYVSLISENILFKETKKVSDISKIDHMFNESIESEDIHLAHSIAVLLKEYYTEAREYNLALCYAEQIEEFQLVKADQENIRKMSYLTSKQEYESSLAFVINTSEKSRFRLFVIIFSLILIISYSYYLYRHQYQKHLVIEKELSLEKCNIEQELTSLQYNRNEELQYSQLEYADLIYENISMRLHDDISNTLAGIRFGISSLKKSKKDPVFNRILTYLDELYSCTRKLSHQIQFPEEAKSNYAGFLSNYFFQNSLIPVKCDIDSPIFMNSISDNLKSEVFRILKECVINANKHSQATELIIGMKRMDHSLEVVIKDNGIGLNKNSTQNGVGIKNMNKRIRLLKGVLTIENKDPKGLRIYFSIPLYQESAEIKTNVSTAKGVYAQADLRLSS